jgi:protein O-mannosyl-transferase
MTKELKSSTSLLILVALVLAVYYPAISAPLNSVDDTVMYQYLLNTDGLTLRGIFLPGGSGNYFRPVLLASFLADKYLWGLQESFMHLENVLFHLVNTLLVYFVARRAVLLRGGAPVAVALVAAAFFAVHPLNTEAVDWISGRTDLLACFFLLLSALLLLCSPCGAIASCGAACCMLAACLAKETAFFFLPAALLWPLFPKSSEDASLSLRELLRRGLPHLAIFAAVGGGYLMFRRIAFSQGDQGVARVLAHVAGGQGQGIVANLRLLLKALGFYAKKLVLPFPLNFGISHVSDGYLFIGGGVCIVILYLLRRRTLPGLFFVSAASVGCSALMIPMLGVTWTPLAERYMYIPGAFFVVALTLTLRERRTLLQCRRCFLAGLSALFLIALYGTATRNLLWQDNLALFQDTLRKSPDFIPARNEVANALFERGREREARALYNSFSDDGSIINPQLGWVNKAFALAVEGRFDEARRVLKRTLQNPGKNEALILRQMLQLNKVQVMQKKALSADLYSDNVWVLRRLIELTHDPFYQYRLGIVEMQDGDRGRAKVAFLAAARDAAPTAYYREPALKLGSSMAETAGKNVGGR